MKEELRKPIRSHIGPPRRERRRSFLAFEFRDMEKEYDLRKRTKAFALRIIRLFAALPKTTAAQVLGRQVLRSATSVGANYREAYRGRSKAEFASKAGECLRELEETAYWLELLVESQLLAPDRIASVQQECHELTAIFVVILRKTRASLSTAK